MKFPKVVIPAVIAFVLLTACSSNAPEPVSSSPGDVPGTAIPPTEVPATVAGLSSTDIPLASEKSVLPEEQTVLSSFSQPVTAGGQPLVLYGHVLDVSGTPLSGYSVEIWQVDANSIYDHPGDSNTTARDMGFQFYGTVETDENGLFAFRTIFPARYEPRPRHIHLKVKQDGHELLTSQFYFTGEVDAAQLGTAGELLLLDLRDAQDASGNAVKLAFKDVVMDTGSGGNLTLTPTQVEGPYYPVVDVSAFDNDLASVQ